MVRALASCARGPGFYPGCMCVCERVVTPLPRVQEVLGSIWSACFFVREWLHHLQECKRSQGLSWLHVSVTEWLECMDHVQEVLGSILVTCICCVVCQTGWSTRLACKRSQVLFWLLLSVMCESIYSTCLMWTRSWVLSWLHLSYVRAARALISCARGPGFYSGCLYLLWGPVLSLYLISFSHNEANYYDYLFM